MSDVSPHPPVRDPRHPFLASPFTRLARTHAFSVAGDALFTVGLAGSVFFNVPLGEARWKVGLYLLLTFAPFAVAAPLIGPVLDRLKGGRRWVIITSLALRALLCVLIVRDFTHYTFYLEAFLMLVFGKAYLISRAAVVPTTVSTDRELVEANSKLSLLSGISAVVAAIPGAILLKVGGDELGPELTVGLAAVVFAVGVGFATRLPRVVVADEPPGAAEKLELRSAGIRLAASAMSLIRVSVGLLLLMLAFAFKNGDVELWFVGAAGLMAQAGVLTGAALAPRLRKVATEPRIIVGSLGVTAVSGALAWVIGGVIGAGLLSFILGTTSGTAKQAFDALVQRDAPDANRGRSFARFETRFQLAWVIGAFIPVVIPFPWQAGYVIIATITTVGVISYWLGQRRVARGTYEWESAGRKLIRHGWRKVGPGRGAAVDDTGTLPPPAGGPGAGAAGVAPAPPPSPPSPRPSSAEHRPTHAPSAATAEWTPPAGFVSRPLAAGDDVTTVGGPPSSTDPTVAAPPSVQPADATAHTPPTDQPRLPFEGEDETVVDDVDLMAEPRWRDSPT